MEEKHRATPNHRPGLLPIGRKVASNTQTCCCKPPLTSLKWLRWPLQQVANKGFAWQASQASPLLAEVEAAVPGACRQQPSSTRGERWPSEVWLPGTQAMVLRMRMCITCVTCELPVLSSTLHMASPGVGVRFFGATYLGPCRPWHAADEPRWRLATAVLMNQPRASAEFSKSKRMPANVSKCKQT